MSIGRNALYNMVGFVVPTVLGLASIPAYIHLIGQERYGVLALAWLILGYFGVFDLGLGRATSQRVAALRDAPPEDRQRAVATSLVSNLAIGGLGAAILLPVTLYLFGHSFGMSAQLRAEAVVAAPLIALALPIATTVGVLSGALMGREQFYQINRISIVSTLFFQLLPLAIAWLIGPTLIWLLAASVFARLVSVAMMWRACRREFGTIGLAHWDRGQLKGLLSFGGWVVLTGLFGPLLVYTDRLLIGTLIGVAAVTVYTVPMDAMMRLAGISTALNNAMFPRLTITDEAEAHAIADKAVGAFYAILTPIAMGGLLVMDPVMRLWLGHDLGGDAALLARLFLTGVWLNSFAQAAYARLQAKGRPDLVSKILMAQLPFYLAAVAFALWTFGLIGAAWVFVIRIVVDTLALHVYAFRRLLKPVLMLSTLAVLIALSALLQWRAPLDWQLALLFGIGAGMLALVPAWAVAPETLRNLLRDRVFRPVGRILGRG